VDSRPGGILDPHGGHERYDEALHQPAPDLAELVAHFWGVRWDLRRRDPYLVQVLPHPSVQLVVEGGQSRIHGVATGKFARLLKEQGEIFGVSFRPAGFRPFLGASVSALTDRVVPASDVFGPDADTLAELLWSLRGSPERVETAEAFIRSRLPAPDPSVPVLNQIVDWIMADRTIIRVDDVVHRAEMGKRTLQRMFKNYVGVTPKWIIQRYRLHEAADRLADEETIDLAALAQDLGYADQAHFIRDFRAVVGRPPAEYARSVRPNA
jgi:AraC-like DNA-binding protein